MLFKKMNCFTDFFTRFRFHPILFHSFSTYHNRFGINYDVCKCKDGFYLLEVRWWRVFGFFERYSYSRAYVDNLTDCIDYIDRSILFLQRRYGSFSDVSSFIPLSIALDNFKITKNK